MPSCVFCVAAERVATATVRRVVPGLDELMGLALEEAAAASAHGDVPIGAVVAGRDGTVIARRHNERELHGDPTAHAELLALRDAAIHVGGWRLDGCVLVSTIEPCPMCAGAALAARITTVVFGAPDPTRERWQVDAPLDRGRGKSSLAITPRKLVQSEIRPRASKMNIPGRSSLTRGAEGLGSCLIRSARAVR